MDVYNLNDIEKIIDLNDNYIVIRFSGLFGDVLHGMSKLQHIINLYPTHSIIVIHSYGSLERVQLASEFFNYLYDIGKVKYYFYHHEPGSRKISRSIILRLNNLNITTDRIFDLYVFAGKPKLLIPPLVGIDIPNTKEQKKCVLLRYSKWHGHFLQRNRPINEWKIIERNLLDLGYTCYLVGVDDIESNFNNLIDYRNKFTVLELLDFTKDCELVITTTTFLYLWTQWVCPTFVLSDPGDVSNLNRIWKMNSNMMVQNVSNPNYINNIFDVLKLLR